MKRSLGVVIGIMLLGTMAGFAQMMGDEEMKMQGKGMGMGNGMGMNGMMMQGDGGNINRYLTLKQELNLTPEQVTALEKIRDDHRKSAIKTNADLKIAQMELGDLLKKDTPDFGAAREKVKQINAAQQQMKISMIDAYEKAYNTLTKEQQQKLPQVKSQMRRKKMDGMPAPMKK